jgi:hypothetical protein
MNAASDPERESGKLRTRLSPTPLDRIKNFGEMETSEPMSARVCEGNAARTNSAPTSDP